jgi:D-alanyl-D-alanine carboxypeptidase (penicillin-binding protein 5/6)
VRLLAGAALTAALVAVPAAATATTTATTPSTTGPTATPSATGAPSPVVGGERLASRRVVTDLPAGVPAPPALPAAAYVLADASSGQVVVARDAHGRFLPASTLKTLTVLTVLPRLDPDTRVQATPEDLVDGTQVGLDPGSHYTVQQLLQGTMLASGNDTATALARVAGGVPQTVQAMQDTARHLGAYDTTVRNPSGLDAPGQLTSAYDLALVARAAMQLPDFRTLVATKRVRFPGKEVRGHRRASYQIQNHNTLIYNYPGATGVKNGYTVAARWTTVGAATRDGRSYLLSALRRTDRSWRPEAALLDWAFAHGQQARPVGRLVEPGEVEATPSVTPSAAATGAAAQTVPAAPGGLGSRASTVVGAAGLAAALLAVTLFGLSARARQRQLHAARVARLQRREPR